MALNKDETIFMRQFRDKLIKVLGLGKESLLEGDVILVFKTVPDKDEIDRLRKRAGSGARIKAIVCDEGTPEAHFSISAAQGEIIAVTGVLGGVFDQVKDGDTLLVFGFNGKVIKDPSPATLMYLPDIILEERTFYEYIRSIPDHDAVSANGLNIKVMANADNPAELQDIGESGAQGIGLVRTENLYDLDVVLNVDELIMAFRVLAEKAGRDNKITIRLFDKQPDKKMPCLPKSPWYGFQYYRNDENGRKAVMDELRALYLVFLEYPDIRIMFPQVSTHEDVDFAMGLINEVKQELVRDKGIDRELLDKLEIGFLVETPAAVNNIRYLLRHADFVSIGTNDLTELTFKVDRNDMAAVRYFVKLQPEILKYIYEVVKAVKEVNRGLPQGKRRKEVSICGDLAKFSKFLPFLLAVSDEEAQLYPSMPSRFILLAKELIRTLDVTECKELFEDIIKERISDVDEINYRAQVLVDRAIERMKERSEYKTALERLLRDYIEPPQGALIGKVIDENGEIITEYITGEVKGRYLILRDKRKPRGKPVGRIRCAKEHVKEEMVRELKELLEEAKLPVDSIERRYIQAIIEYTMSRDVEFYVLKEDIKNIYGFANDRIFCLYEPFLAIPAAFFHEAGESFFLSKAYRRFLSADLSNTEWLRYKGKARVVVDGEERLIPAHTYLRGLGKKARAKQRKLTEAEGFLPAGKGLEDILFGEENITVSNMIMEQKQITEALKKLEAEDWVRSIIPELKKFTKFFPDRSENEIILFIRDLIQVQSISKVLDLLVYQLYRKNQNLNMDLLQCIIEIEGLLNLLYQHVPYTKIKRSIEVTLKELKRPKGESSLEPWRKNVFIMKALVRFFKRIEKAELHHHLDGALSPDLILKILCLFPEARERFVRDILGKKEGSVNEIFANEVGGPKTEKGWELLQYSLQYLFYGRASGEGDFVERFGGISGYNKAIRGIKRHLEYRPTEIGTVNIIEFLKKFGLTGLALYCNPEALRILAREATLETYRKDNTTLIEQKMHNLTFGQPLFTVVTKVLQGLREAESISKDKLKTALILCIFKNPELVLGERYDEVVKASEQDTRSIEAIRYSIWQEIEDMLGNDFGNDMGYVGLEKKELDEAIAELRRTETSEKDVRKRLLITWEERKEGIRQIREIIRAKQQLALNYPELAKRLIAIDTVGSEVDYLTWVHSYGLRLAKRYGFRITDHAGESWPEEDIWQALNRVKWAIETGVVERIGHSTCLGIHPEALRESRFSDGRPMYTLEEIKEIERLQQRILGMMKERNIVLETNPSSNLLLLPKYITTYARHPIQYFWRRLKGLLVVSSDDPHILHTIGLSGELSKVWLAHPNFKFGELLEIIKNGFSHSFTIDERDTGGQLQRPLWDGVIEKERVRDLSGYHPSSIVNRVRDFSKWLPVLDYQRVGEYPQDLIELEQSLTLHAVGWEKTISGEYGAFATPAGMPAINIMLDSAIERKGLGRDAEIILIEPPYGCTKNLFDRLQRTDYNVHLIPVREIESRLPGLINDKTGIIYLESVANPTLMVPGIEFILRENRGRAAVLVDDTFATYEMIRSLEIEADGYSVDMSMIGLTKGATGTGNIISGAVVAKKEWHELLAKRRNSLPEEQEIKRAKRGLCHIAIRFKTQSRNACALASEIERNDLVGDMVYPKNGHMLYYVYKKLCNAIDNINLLAKFRTMINAVSLGQIRNLFERPSASTHSTVGEEARRKGGISPAGIRGSIGIESKEDVLREIRAMLEIISIYGDAIPQGDMEDINKIFMAEFVTQEEDSRTVRYLLPKWPIPHQTFERLISDLDDIEKGRLREKYSRDERFRSVVDILIKATEITEYDPVNIAIHHRLIWCLLSGDHNSVIASPIESTTTHKQDDRHMEDTFASILAGKKKGFPPEGDFALYSRLGKPGIASLELLTTLLEVGAEKTLNYDYIATSFYTERMAQLSFLSQLAEIAMMDAVKDPEIIIVTPRGTVLEEEAKMAARHGAVKFRIIRPEDLENEVSDKTIMVYFDNLRIRGYDPVKIRDIVKGKNPGCLFGITDSFNLGYENPRTERDFDFITHVIYYENADKGAVVIARNDKPLTDVWNNPFWSRKNRGTAMSEDNAVEALWYVLPYLRVFDERYDENVKAVTKLLSDLFIVKRIDKRNLELEFKSREDRERFLALAWESKLISASNFPLPAYFSVNEWTSIRPKDKDSNSLILQVGIEETDDLVKEIKAIIAKFIVPGDYKGLGEEMSKCVTGDTLLPIVQGSTHGCQTSVWEGLEDKPIVDVKPGDYVLSLNEITQQIEPHRINALLDMGIKPVYRLTTASGRSIKTTANHPYLARNGWVKVSGLKAGNEIGVPRLHFMDSITTGLSNDKSAEQVFFGDPFNQVFEQNDNFIFSEKINSEEDNTAVGSNRVAENITKVSITGNENKGFSFYQFVNFLVRCSWFNVSNIFYIIASLFKTETNVSWAIGINEKLHRFSSRVANKFLFICQEGTIQNACLDVFTSNRRKFSFYIFNAHSSSQCLEDYIYRSAGSPYTRSSMLDTGVNTNMFFQQFLVNHYLPPLFSESRFEHVTQQKYNILINIMSTLFSLPELEAAEIGGDILWDRIVSIDYIGYEHVYDIEVERTHNFIGNGIFAHNTYVGVSGPENEGAIGKGSCLARKGEVEVVGLNDQQKVMIRDALDKLRGAISKAHFIDEEKSQAEEAIRLLEVYFASDNIVVFDALVEGPEDYLLAFPRERDHIIALARDFLGPDYIIQFYYHRLPEILFHEGLASRFGERDYEEHRARYMGIQRRIFGKYNELANDLRNYIYIKSPAGYRIEFDQATLNDRKISIDRITSLLQDKEFIYKTLKKTSPERKKDIPDIRIRKIKVGHGGTGSQKQTLHIGFIDENSGLYYEFALKVAINRAAMEGFAKGEKDEIPTLRELSGKCRIPVFGIYVEEPGDNFYAYTEEWIDGPTAAQAMARGMLTKTGLTNIVSSYLSVIRALDTRSRSGGYLGIYDVQAENAMFKSWEHDEAVTVDIGKIDYVKSLFILQEFDRHYSRGNKRLHGAIFDGVINTFGKQKGISFLEEAFDASISDRREVRGYTREMAKGLAGSIREYLETVYIKNLARWISRRLEKTAFMVLTRLANNEDIKSVIAEFSSQLEELYREVKTALENEMTLSSRLELEVVELFLRSIDLDFTDKPPALDLVERILDIVFLLNLITEGKIQYRNLEDGQNVLDLEYNRPKGNDTLFRHRRESHTYPPKDTLDGLELIPEDVYLNLGGGPGVNNIAACLRGVKKSIYLDVSKANLDSVVFLNRHYEDIVNDTGLRDRIENGSVSIEEIMGIITASRGEEVDTQTPLEPVAILPADAAHISLRDDSVTKVSVLGLFLWIMAQGGKGKVIHTMRETLRITKTGGLILHRADNSEEVEFINRFPEIAQIMGIVIRLKKVTALKGYVYEIVNKSGDIYGGIVSILNREMGLSLSSEELRKTTRGDLIKAFRVDNGMVDKEDLRLAEKVARIVDGFNLPNETKLELTQGVIILIRQDKLRERIKQQIAMYGTLRGRIKSAERYVFIDKECLPKNQQYILEGDEWGRRKQLLERMFPGYRFGVFSGALESSMNRDNTIVLTNKKIEIDARLVFITNAGEQEYFPIDGLIFLGVGLLNLSPADKNGSPLVSTITRLYKEITGQDIDIRRFLDTYSLDIILPPIGRFNTELQSYAITLLEQSA